MNARVLALFGLSAVTLLLVAAPAHSDDDEPSVYSEARKYFSGYGYGSIQTLPGSKIGSGTDKGEIQNPTSSGAGGGVGFIAGIRSNSWMAFEAQYEYIVGPKISGCLVRDDKVDTYAGCPEADDPPGEPRDDESYSLHNGWINAKFFPLHGLLDGVMDGRFQPYAKAGGGVMIAVDLGTKTPIAFAGRFGGGADLHMGENWSLGLDFGYMVPSANLEGLNTFTIGLGAAYYFY